MTHTDSHASTTRGNVARVGYVRVSTVAQTLDQQNAALAAAGVTKTFSDKMLILPHLSQIPQNPITATLLRHVWQLRHGGGLGSAGMADGHHRVSWSALWG